MYESGRECLYHQLYSQQEFFFHFPRQLQRSNKEARVYDERREETGGGKLFENGTGDFIFHENVLMLCKRNYFSPFVGE